MKKKQAKKKITYVQRRLKKCSLKRLVLISLWFSLMTFTVLVTGTVIFLLFIDLLGEEVLTRKELITSTVLASVLLVFILLGVANFLKRYKKTLFRWTRRSLKILALLVIAPLIITIISIFAIDNDPSLQNSDQNTTSSSDLEVKQPIDFDSLSFENAKLFEETNVRRSASGVAGLVLNEKLSTAAKNKCDDMIAKNYWSHNDPAGNEPWYFLTNAGYNYEWAGENLAFGYETEKDVVDGWMISNLHKENLLSAKYKDVGFGLCKGDNFNNMGKRLIVVQFFGKQQATSTSSSNYPSSSRESDNSSECASLYSTYYTVPMIGLSKPTSTYIIHYIGNDDYDLEVSKYNNKVAVYNSAWQKNKSKFLNEANIAKCDTSLYTLMMDIDEARPYPVN